MFSESPFSGACGASTWEVLFMLLGTLLLGLLLGYLIWGWMKKRLSLLEKRIGELEHIAYLKDNQIVDLNTRVNSLKTHAEELEMKLADKDRQYQQLSAKSRSVESSAAIVASPTVVPPPVSESLDTGDSPNVASQPATSTSAQFPPTPAEVTGVSSAFIPDDTDEKSEMKKSGKGGKAGKPGKAGDTKKEKTPKSAKKSSEKKKSKAPKEDAILAKRSKANEAERSRKAQLKTGTKTDSLKKASAVFGKKVKANDLKRIEGIGPKIEKILNQNKIKTWAKLSEANLPTLRKILEKAGPRYRLHDPKTWARQARMAARGEWRKLKVYQDTLTRGK